MPAVAIEEIRGAAERIQGIALRTPVMTSRSVDREAGLNVWFKCENLQCGGSFKIRGAANFIFSIDRSRLSKGVVAYSSGNHAQAVAIAARARGARATIVMPSDAPRSKLEATRGYGAAIVSYERLKENREAIGRRIAEETGATLVPPYDHAWTIAGQGTTALEMLEQAPELDALIAPVGGGGLLAGCAVAAKALSQNIRIFGAEPADGNDTCLSLRAGHRVEIPPPATVADGLRATQPGEITFPILQKLAENVVLVGDDEIRATVKFLLTRMKILVEPSGAAAAAAVLYRKLPPGIRSVGVILSGGNMDFELLTSL